MTETISPRGQLIRHELGERGRKGTVLLQLLPRIESPTNGATVLLLGHQRHQIVLPWPLSSIFQLK